MAHFLNNLNLNSVQILQTAPLKIKSEDRTTYCSFTNSGRRYKWSTKVLSTKLKIANTENIFYIWMEAAGPREATLYTVVNNASCCKSEQCSLNVHFKKKM